MVSTTNLQLPLLAASQAQKHVTHNEALLRLDGICQLSALSYSVAAQPASPADGDIYLLPPGKTGTDWGAAANHAIAHYYDGVWHFYSPRGGWVAFVQDTDQVVVYDGSTWERLGTTAATRPTFMAYLNASTTNDKTGDGSDYQVICNTEVHDYGGDYDTTTGVFTAPVDGIYAFAFAVTALNLDADSYERVQISVFAGGIYFVPTKMTGVDIYEDHTGNATFALASTFQVELDANDTVFLVLQVAGGTKSVGIEGQNTRRTFFSGSLIN